MFLTKYTVENLGVFRGKHEFDLRTQDSRPVILFGGRNGSGKTTLFEGIRLCLYGRNYGGLPLSRPRYEKYLKERAHRHSGLVESEDSSVSLEFQHSHLGKVSSYYVRRSWHSTDLLDERLEVLQDGNPVTGMMVEQLQDFLMELIPVGLSRLFFFDGEQIQHLAEDDFTNTHLQDAINSFLGLDVIDQLARDLRIYLNRQEKEKDSSSTPEIGRIDEERKSQSKQLELLFQQKAEKQTDIDHLISEIEHQKHELASAGGGYSEKRESLMARKAVLESQTMSLENKIREQAVSFLPFAVIPSLCKKLKEKITLEETQKQEIAAKNLLNDASKRVTAQVLDRSFWKDAPHLDDTTKEVVTSKIIRLLESFLERPETDYQFVHHLSTPDQERLSYWIDESLNSTPRHIQEAGSQLEITVRELQQLHKSLARAPPEEAIGPIVDSLNSLHEQLGENSQELKRLEDKTKTAEYWLKDSDRKLEKIKVNETQEKSSQERLELTKKIQDALSIFSTRIRKKKISELGSRFSEVFNQLSTKKNLVERVEINPEDFHVKLIRRNGVEVQKEYLAAGEKQIFAIAFLVALAKVSQRPLPFVIDTPLARLDSEHRTNLVSEFLPYTSHQVIIFSTDTEIDQEYFHSLQEFLSRSFLLEYDSIEERTIVSPKYFWSSEPEAIESELQ